MSLIIYPIIIAGLLLYQAGLVGPGFWALVSGGGAVFVSAVHFGPYAVEPPAMIIDGYDSPIAGWLAFILLVTFVTVLAVTSLYEPGLVAAAPGAAHRPASCRRGRPSMTEATPAMRPSGSSPAALQPATAVLRFARCWWQPGSACGSACSW